MANTIQLKRSNISGRIPGTSPAAALASGELAFNFADNKLYFGNNSGNTTDITDVITKATNSVLGKASFASADFAVTNGAVTIASGGVSNTQLAGSISDGKLNKITAPNKIEIQSLDIDNAQDIAADLVATDTIIVDDGAAGTNRKSAISRLATLMGGNGLAVSGATLAVGVDGATVELSSDAVRVKDGGITLAKMAANSINSDQYVDGSIDTIHIGDFQITAGKIATGAVVASKLENTTSASTGAVTSDKFRPGAVNEAALGDNSVSNAKMKDNSVDTDELVNDAVTAIKIVDNITLAGDCGTTGDFQVGGDLTVIGTQTQVNSTTVTLDDVVLTLGGDTAPANNTGVDMGIEFRYKNAQVGAQIGFFGYDDSVSKFTMLTSTSNSSGAYTGSPGVLKIGTLEASSVTGATINCGTF